MMKNWLKISSTSFLLTLAIHPGCSEQQQTIFDKDRDKIPVQEGWNQAVRVTRNGKLSARLEYGHFMKFANNQDTHFDEGLQVYFFNKAGRQTSTLTANSGTLTMANHFEAVGNVILVANDGRKLETERLNWNNDRQQIRSDAFVKITTAEGDTLTGTGFEADQSLNSWLLHSPRGNTTSNAGENGPNLTVNKTAAEDSLQQANVNKK